MKAVNELIRDELKHDKRVKICHHENLQKNDKINDALYKQDKYHLNSLGTKLLASNLRHAVEDGYSRWRKETKDKRNIHGDHDYRSFIKTSD